MRMVGKYAGAGSVLYGNVNDAAVQKVEKYRYLWRRPKKVVKPQL